MGLPSDRRNVMTFDTTTSVLVLFKLIIVVGPEQKYELLVYKDVFPYHPSLSAIRPTYSRLGLTNTVSIYFVV